MLSKLSLENVQKIARRGALAIPLVLGVAAVSLAESGSPASQTPALVTSESTQDPTESSTPDVTVNGQKVPVGEDGSVTLNDSSNNTHVQISGGTTTITTAESETSSDNEGQNNNHINVKIDSDSNGGDDWSSTRVYGFSTTNNGSSRSFSSTNVFSAGSGNVDISSD